MANECLHCGRNIGLDHPEQFCDEMCKGLYRKPTPPKEVYELETKLDNVIPQLPPNPDIIELCKRTIPGGINDNPPKPSQCDHEIKTLGIPLPCDHTHLPHNYCSICKKWHCHTCAKEMPKPSQDLAGAVKSIQQALMDDCHRNKDLIDCFKNDMPCRCKLIDKATAQILATVKEAHKRFAMKYCYHCHLKGSQLMTRKALCEHCKFREKLFEIKQ